MRDRVPASLFAATAKLVTGHALALVLLAGVAEASGILAQGRFRGHRYQIRFEEGGIDWAQASRAAADLGGHLATLRAAPEDDFLFQLSGGNDVPRSCGQKLLVGGLRSSSRRAWEWVDGGAWQYDNWLPGEPRPDPNALRLVTCVASSGAACREGRWSSVAKNDRLRCFAVEYPSSRRATQVQPTCCGSGRLTGDWTWNERAASDPEIPEMKETVSARIRATFDLHCYYREVDGADGELAGTGEILEAGWVAEQPLYRGGVGFSSRRCDFGDTVTRSFELRAFLRNLEPDSVQIQLVAPDREDHLRFPRHQVEDCNPPRVSGEDGSLVEPVMSEPLTGLAPFQPPIAEDYFRIPLDENGNGQVRLQHRGEVAMGLCADLEGQLEAAGLESVLEIAGPLPQVDFPHSCTLDSDFTIQLTAVGRSDCIEEEPEGGTLEP